MFKGLWKIVTAFLITFGLIIFISPQSWAFVRGEVAANKVNIRTEASLSSDVLFMANQGQPVDILEVTGDFYKINLGLERNRYIAREYVEIVEIGYEYADLIFRDTGLHVIGLITYKGICSDYAETEFVVYSDTGMQQAKKALSVFDYVMTSPNPTADFFDLTLKTRTDADLLIRIFNADNHKPIQILKRNAKAGQLFKETLSVQGYAKGIYILTVQSETEIKVLKIVVI